MSNKDISVIAKAAYESRKHHYYAMFFFAFIGIFFAFVMCMSISAESTEPGKFTMATGIIFSIVVIAIIYGMIRSTGSFLKCRKNYISKNYTYHHVEIETIRICT